MGALDSKGMEYDAVLVVEPAQIRDEAKTGFRTLYVALSRAYPTFDHSWNRALLSLVSHSSLFEFVDFWSARIRNCSACEARSRLRGVHPAVNFGRATGVHTVPGDVTSALESAMDLPSAQPRRPLRLQRTA